MLQHRRVQGFTDTYIHSPSGAVHIQDCAYISVKHLAAVLQYINVASSSCKVGIA